MKTCLFIVLALLIAGPAVAQMDPDTKVSELTNEQILAWVLGPRDSTGTVTRFLTAAEIDTARAALGFHQGSRDSTGALRMATWDEFQSEVLSRVKGPIVQWVTTYNEWKLKQEKTVTWGE